MKRSTLAHSDLSLTVNPQQYYLPIVHILSVQTLPLHEEGQSLAPNLTCWPGRRCSGDGGGWSVALGITHLFLLGREPCILTYKHP